MGKIFFKGKKISDADINNVLRKIAKNIGDVHVTSGDRKHIPKGGSTTSCHLKNQAVDFGIGGMSLEDGFKKLIAQRQIIFNPSKRYEVIYHGNYTNTPGRHLHIGRYSTGVGIVFKTEGTTLTEQGYTIVSPG